MLSNGSVARKVLLGTASPPSWVEPLLRAAGYETLVAASGAQALFAIDNLQCHVAVLDEELCDPSTLSILRTTRGSRVPIIVCSDVYNANRAVTAMKEGACMYLPAPVNQRELLGAVAGAFQSLRVVAPFPDGLAERQRQAQKMELFGRLAGGVIHDFNNLLTVILGYCGVLKTDKGGPEHIREIEQTVHNGAALTGQLLAFARSRPLELRPLDVNFLLLRMEAMLGRLLREPIRVDMRLADEIGLIHADQNQLEQVILNLAINARDAMPDGGQLIFATANLEVAHGRVDMAPGHYVVIKITDTGCGMDETTQARLFEPFFTTKPEGQGTGLGLATVCRIVAAAHGYIDVVSQPGRGTTFALAFPRICDSDIVSTVVPEHSVFAAAIGGNGMVSA